MRIVAAAVVLAVVAAVVGGFLLFDSPSERRAIRLDIKRERGLEDIERGISLFRDRKARLPERLGELGTVVGDWAEPADPETGAPYDYSVTGEETYELCAVFALDSDKHPLRRDWWHKAGRTCFERKVR